MRIAKIICPLLLLSGLAAGAADLEREDAPEPAPVEQPAPAPPGPGGTSGTAADSLPPPPEDVAPPAGESWWQSLVRSMPGCAVLSDGCRTCRADGLACSNLPIACQPKEWTCRKQSKEE